MKWDTNLINLRDLLADLYWKMEDARRVVQQAGIKPIYIRFDEKPLNNWHNILERAYLDKKIQNVIEIAQRENPEHDDLLALAKQNAFMTVKNPDPLVWRVTTDADQLEKITGIQSTLLPISFLELGQIRSKSVALVKRGDGGIGSGFLTESNLLITNNHVLSSASEAEAAEVHFNVQKSHEGFDLPATVCKLAPNEGFATSKANDWTAVRVQGNPNQSWGAIKLEKVDVKVNDWVNIIQHPGGGHKQIALYHNTVMFADEKVVQYLTDTLPGSSGSPVFDSRWRVVALHHKGVTLYKTNSKQSYYCNEGIYVNVVVDGLVGAGLLMG